MKPLKKAIQKNVELDKNCYMPYEIEELESIEGIGKHPYDKYTTCVFLEYVKDLKVICMNGYYATVAVMNSGETVFVEL